MTLLGHGAGSNTPCPARERIPSPLGEPPMESVLLEPAESAEYNQELDL